MQLVLNTLKGTTGNSFISSYRFELKWILGDTIAPKVNKGKKLIISVCIADKKHFARQNICYKADIFVITKNSL